MKIFRKFAVVQGIGLQEANVLIYTRRSQGDSKEPEKILEIYGLKDNVLMAKGMIENLLVQEEEGHRISEEGQLRHWEEMVIPDSKVHLFETDLELKLYLLEGKISVLVWLSGQSDGSQILEIYGLEQNVNKAKKIVKYLLSNKITDWSDFFMSRKEIAIPASKIHLIIGESEEKIGLLEKIAKVLTWVSEGSDESRMANKTLEIYGDLWNVGRVKHLVTSCLLPIQDIGQFMRLAKIVIPASKVSLIHSVETTLEKHASVLVCLSGQRDGSQACDEILEIYGLRKKVSKAKKIVENFISQKHYPWKDDKCVTWDTVDISASNIHLIMGENKEKADLFKQKANVLIWVSEGSDHYRVKVDDKTLWIYGPDAKVKKVKYLVDFLMDLQYIGQPWQWEEIVIPESNFCEIVVSFGCRQVKNLELCYILHIFGEENTVQKLKKLVENSLFYETIETDGGEDSWDEEEDADNEQTRKAKISIPALQVYGIDTEKLMEVEKRAEVEIMVAANPDPVTYTMDNRLVILGPQHNIVKAKKMIRDLMSHADH